MYTVYKRNHLGENKLSYDSVVLERSETHVVLRAEFKLKTRDLGYMLLKYGDIFTEWFYANHWFNVFRVQDIDTGEIKGFYCNLTRPAEIHDDYVAADDLALDIFVKPNGETLLLDEDEYNDLPLSETDRQQVQQAVETIYTWVVERHTPFEDLS